MATDPNRQATYCLAGGYAACDRYPERQLPPRASERPFPRTKVQGSAVIAFRVHVVRADESLAGIAADHGVTTDQVARANGLAVTDAVTDGVRMVIPLVPASSTYGPTPDHRRPDRFG